MSGSRSKVGALQPYPTQWVSLILEPQTVSAAGADTVLSYDLGVIDWPLRSQFQQRVDAALSFIVRDFSGLANVPITFELVGMDGGALWTIATAQQVLTPGAGLSNAQFGLVSDAFGGDSVSARVTLGPFDPAAALSFSAVGKLSARTVTGVV